MRMEFDLVKGLHFPHDDDVETGDYKSVNQSKNLMERPDGPPECARSDTPLSNSSTSGICSITSYDSDSNDDEKPLSQNDDLGIESETKDNVDSSDSDDESIPEPEIEIEPVIMYKGRNILDLGSNLNQYTIFQPICVPKMDLQKNGNYWESRSIYHRLGPFGNLTEIEYKQCPCCDFKTPQPLEISLFI